MKILTIDPGKNGGLAFFDGATVTAIKMPATDAALIHYLRSLGDSEPLTGVRDGQPIRVVIELVGGYINGNPTPGSHNFKFGEGYGFIRGACLALGYEVELVRPQRWQKMFCIGKLKGNERKRELKRVAQERYQDHKVTLATGDALLLMLWAMENIND